MLSHVLLAFLFLQLPQNDTIPQGFGSHTTLNREVHCNLSFYWLHSGFYNHSETRLQSEMTIAEGLGLLKSMVQDFFLCLKILTYLRRKMTIHLLRGQVDYV